MFFRQKKNPYKPPQLIRDKQDLYNKQIIICFLLGLSIYHFIVIVNLFFDLCRFLSKFHIYTIIEWGYLANEYKQLKRTTDNKKL